MAVPDWTGLEMAISRPFLDTCLQVCSCKKAEEEGQLCLPGANMQLYFFFFFANRKLYLNIVNS